MKLIAEVRVCGLALVPWSAPEIGTGRSKSNRKFRFVKKEPRLVALQENLSRFAKAVMGDRPAHDGPCYLDLDLLKRTEKEELWGQWCYVPLGGAKNLRGDLTNIVKAIEDGLEGVCYKNDQLVCAGRQMIRWSCEDGIFARVYALEPIEDDPTWHPTP